MSSLQSNDPQIFSLIQAEEKRQFNTVRLIPSENYASQSILEATGSILTNKYSEGYPHKRYYFGQENIDEIETLAINRAKELFKAEHANVQPYSGSPANQAAYMALLEPGDTIMGLNLLHGGHLTHGWKVSFSGKLFNSVQYELDPTTSRLNYDNIYELAKEHKPKMLIAGISAYPREIDFAKFGEIAKSVGAYLLSDISHINGLICSGLHSDPVPYSDIVTSTSHKLLRGPRGGFMLSKQEHAKKIDKAVFPCLQGGPHNHTTAAMAVCFKEANTEGYRNYAKQVISNAKALADTLLNHGYNLITGGTDNHLLLIDMISSKDITGNEAAAALEKVGIICNSNSIPYDKRKPFDPSGIRVGTPAITTLGFKENEMNQVGEYMVAAIDNRNNEGELNNIKAKVTELINSVKQSL